jgi:hypothetical protein
MTGYFAIIGARLDSLQAAARERQWDRVDDELDGLVTIFQSWERQAGVIEADLRHTAPARPEKVDPILAAWERHADEQDDARESADLDRHEAEDPS